MKIYSWDDIPSSEPRPGVKGKTIKGEKASISYFEMQPGTASPLHDHDNEQINYVLEGEIEFSSGDDVQVLKAGQVVVFAPWESHLVRNVGTTMAKNLGVLSPPRHGDPK
jgi:quercetin dioxygenase-like cupin family protein